LSAKTNAIDSQWFGRTIECGQRGNLAIIPAGATLIGCALHIAL